MDTSTIVEICLTGIYKDDLFNHTLYLKGGQAIRLAQNINTRYSADIDFSIDDKIENSEVFEQRLEYVLSEEFLAHELELFDFAFERRPKEKKDGTPDFWGGWQVTFKLIQKDKSKLPLDKKRREAIVPKGAPSSKVSLDISEYEYCGSTEKIRIKGVEVLTYSRSSLLIEKIRAICQQHPAYQFKGNDSRARDYYDIERLWNKVLVEQKVAGFIEDAKRHLPLVFKAKGVDLGLLQRIFEPQFLELQSSGWKSVETTVSGKLETFDYYVATLNDIIGRIASPD